MSFPDDWSYRRKITISGSPGAGTDRLILFKIGENAATLDYDFHLDGKSSKFPSQQNDSGDLRFSLDDGITLLSFWVEKVEGFSPRRTAYVWVKINANLDINQSIFCFFGNPDAENVSTNVEGSSIEINFSVGEIEIQTSGVRFQGTVCNKNGDPIVGDGNEVRIYLLDKDSGKLLRTATSHTDDGNWSADCPIDDSTKILAVFALEGTYGEDTDIAGAEFLSEAQSSTSYKTLGIVPKFNIVEQSSLTSATSGILADIERNQSSISLATSGILADIIETVNSEVATSTE